LHALFLIELQQGFALTSVEPDQRLGQQKRNNLVDVSVFSYRYSTIAIFSDVIQHLIAENSVHLKRIGDSLNFGHDFFAGHSLECNCTFDHFCLLVRKSVDAFWQMVFHLFQSLN